MPLAEKVKALRKKKNMNQKQLAVASGITQATISRIESGLVRDLKSRGLKQLATTLGVTVDYLVDRTDDLSPDDILKSDETARYILSGYERLSAKGREQLRSFVKFLEAQEEEERLF